MQDDQDGDENDDDGECAWWGTWDDLPFCPRWFLPLVILVFLLLVCCATVACARRRRGKQQQRNELRLVHVDEAPLLGDEDDANMSNLMMNPLATELDLDERSRTLSDARDEARGRRRISHSMGSIASGQSSEAIRKETSSSSYMANPLFLSAERDRAATLYATNPLAASEAHEVDEALLAADGWRALVDDEGGEYYTHTATGATTLEMPLQIQRKRLSVQRDCAGRLRSALASFEGISEDECGGAFGDIVQARTDLEADLATIDAACELGASAVSSVALHGALARTDSNLSRLEDISFSLLLADGGDLVTGADGRLLASGGAGVGDGRRGAELWGTLRDGVGPSKADASWSLILEHIKRMRAQLKPVAQAAEEDAVDASAWVRSLRSKLRPVDRGLRKPSMY